MATKNNWQERFLQAMLERKAALQRALQSNLKTFREDVVPQVDVIDVVEKATGDAADDLAAGLAEIESGQLAQIEKALRCLADGTYGQCQDCLKPIPQKRLLLVPFAIRCVECQRTHDSSRSPHR
jgi:DnaK suppressor protein